MNDNATDKSFAMFFRRGQRGQLSINAEKRDLNLWSIVKAYTSTANRICMYI